MGVDAHGQKTRRRSVTCSRTQPLSATFSPDGRWVAYAATHHRGDRRSHVTKQGNLRATVSSDRRAASSAEKVIDFHPLWAPDGKSILLRPRGRPDRRSRYPSQPARRLPLARLWSCHAPQSPCFWHPMCAATMSFQTVDSSASCRSESEDGSAPMTEFRVVLNWFEETEAPRAGEIDSRAEGREASGERQRRRSAVFVRFVSWTP